MKDFLQLTVELADDGSLELFATVHVASFSGHSSAHFNPREILTFASAVGSSFPITDPIEIRGGFLSDLEPSVIEEEHLLIRIQPVGQRGQLTCLVRLASLQFDSARVESQRVVRVELATSYAEMQRFGPAVSELVNGQRAEVLLYATAA